MLAIVPRSHHTAGKCCATRPAEATGSAGREIDTVADMTASGFLPEDFDPPTSLLTDKFRLEPLGPQHNAADHAAWMSSIEHIHATPGYPDGGWPPPEGMSSQQNLDDLRRHARHFEERVGFTFTVLDPADGDVIGPSICIPLTPPSTTFRCGRGCESAGLSSMARWPTPLPIGSSTRGHGHVLIATVADDERACRSMGRSLRARTRSLVEASMVDGDGRSGRLFADPSAANHQGDDARRAGVAAVRLGTQPPLNRSLP